jgi:hypothetical protein
MHGAERTSSLRLPGPHLLFVKQSHSRFQISGGKMRTLARVTSVVTLVLVCVFASYASAPLLSVMAPRQAHSGSPLQITYTVTNSLSTPLSLTVNHSVTGPCISESGSQTLSLASAGRVGSTQSNSVNYTLPSTSCEGTYTINVSVMYDGTLLSSVSKTVPVS